MAIYMDLTDQKIAEKEKERLLTVVDSTIDLVAISDFKGQTLYVNQVCRKMLGINNSTPFIFDPLGPLLHTRFA